MEVVLNILGLAMIISFFTEGITEVLKKFYNNDIIHSRITSVAVGLTIGYISYLVLQSEWSLTHCLIAGGSAGFLPAPMLHDLSVILRELKDKLKNR